MRDWDIGDTVEIIEEDFYSRKSGIKLGMIFKIVGIYENLAPQVICPNEPDETMWLKDSEFKVINRHNTTHMPGWF